MVCDTEIVPGGNIFNGPRSHPCAALPCVDRPQAANICALDGSAALHLIIAFKGGTAMGLTNKGWEMQIIRESVQTRTSGKARVRTVGSYQIFHDGIKQTGFGMSGMVAESQGPGDNAKAGNRSEERR